MNEYFSFFLIACSRILALNSSYFIISSFSLANLRILTTNCVLYTTSMIIIPKNTPTKKLSAMLSSIHSNISNTYGFIKK